MLYASLTGPLVTFATHVIKTLGLGGVFAMTATTGVIGLPGTEPTMLFAGFDVYQGNQTLLGIIIAGVLGDVLGATIAYAIGYFGRRELLERHGAKFHMSAARLERPTRWFDRHGSPVIFISRLLPGIRAVFPYAAGVSEMPFLRFFLFTTLGSVIWISGLAVLGREVGSNWSTWRRHLEYGDYALAAIVAAAIVYLVLRRVKRTRERSRAAVDAVSK
ncbi:MAG TPA: DedA family protein [Solirubrobacteraceae bacterium]|nr:DedA family protein [Solirubrobacteraceae bacterium]